MTGSGTQADPYIIYDVNDLQAMENDLTAYYELANDIDASATVDWNGGLGFSPVGTLKTNAFTGHLDGKGYVIQSLYINRPNDTSIGLFGWCNAANIENLGLVDATVENTPTVGGGSYNIGILSGAVIYTTITNCYTTGSVTGVKSVGSLVGAIDTSATITGCYSTASVTGALDPSFPANQSGIGGLIGSARGTVSKCYATGTVNAPNHYRVGGFCGVNAASISNCYARGTVTGDDDVGGFVGKNSAGAVINCYSTGAVTGNTDVGGLIGLPGITTNSFWDIETSGQTTSAGGTGKTTAEMKTSSTFTDAGWDLDTIWDITPSCNNDYPCLLDVTPACGVPVVPFIISKSYALAREEL